MDDEISEDYVNFQAAYSKGDIKTAAHITWAVLCQAYHNQFDRQDDLELQLYHMLKQCQAGSIPLTTEREFFQMIILLGQGLRDGGFLWVIQMLN